MDRADLPVTEAVRRFGPDLVGVLALPAGPPRGPAVVLANSGLVHRVGPNRLYVTLARRLAARGHAVLRFDLAGIGDSPRRRDGLPFATAAVEDTVAAMDDVAAATGATRFVLGGVCSGADIALLAAAADPRVAGVAAVNARRFGVDEATFTALRAAAVARHYRRLAGSRSFGARSLGRALRGRLGWAGLARALASQLPRPRRVPPGGTAPLEALLARGVAVYCLHSEADEGLDHLRALAGPELRNLRGLAGFRFDIMRAADHTFTMRWSQRALVERLEAWLAGLPGG